MKKLICAQFCNSLSVNQMRNGYGISTAYTNLDGDAVGFYAIGPDLDGQYRLIDGGSVVPMLESMGATLDAQTRRSLFEGLLSEYGATFDEVNMEIVRAGIAEDDLPKAALSFLALMLRVQDLAYLTIERVESSFREDVIQALRDEIGDRAVIREGEPVSDQLSEEIPDLVIEAKGREPVALFIVTSATKLYQAIQLHMFAHLEAHIPLKVTAMLENETSTTQALRQKADNRLDAVPRYAKAERDAVKRIVREAVGYDAIH
ncbi:hypothetical protein C3941_08835 [Kaistia algarum]|uniref:DUF1828 domain-containing protein n=1 Tax=Kaistia algarum TaxID=2083279 RepID=UPI000CE8E4F1|nr:DUF1828 domain-containing protein [Kaistia algarum]MCX5512164.1 DUF1828 domain-containing protein [Kaistia algarum]PPE80264.1 hypothetical protein C3941_08835 [Kaistia algarum]